MTSAVVTGIIRRVDVLCVGGIVVVVVVAVVVVIGVDGGMVVAVVVVVVVVLVVLDGIVLEFDLPSKDVSSDVVTGGNDIIPIPSNIYIICIYIYIYINILVRDDLVGYIDRPRYQQSVLLPVEYRPFVGWCIHSVQIEMYCSNTVGGLSPYLEL